MDELRQRAEHLLSAIGIDADTQDPDTLVISNPTNFQHVYHVAEKEVPPRALRQRVTSAQGVVAPTLFGAGYRPPVSSGSLPVYDGGATVSRPATSQPLRRKDPTTTPSGGHSTSLAEPQSDAPLPALPLPSHTPPPPRPESLPPAPAHIDSTHNNLSVPAVPPRRPSRPSSPTPNPNPNPHPPQRPTTAPHPPHSAWSDAAFPPDAAMLAADTVASAVVWRRSHELHPSASLFVGGCDPGDVVQGKLGDCWLLGALSVVATQPSLCAKLIKQDPACPGKYIVRLWNFGRWHEVEIDDQIPCSKRSDGTYRPLYSRCTSAEELWVPLIEKGVAKYSGSYARLEGGYVHTGLCLLTGGLPGRIVLKDVRADVDSGKFWDYMIRNSSQCLMACAWGDESSSGERSGLLPDHAYGILELRAVHAHRLIRLRNPWGEKEWRGAWSDDAPQWTSELRALLRHEARNDGTFWMCYEDFVKSFDRLYTCRIVPEDEKHAITGEWRGDGAGGCLNTPKWRHNPQYLLSVSKPGWTYVILEQEARVTPLAHIGFMIVKLPNGQKERIFQIEESHVIAEVVHTDSVAVNVEAYLEAGVYALMPQTFDVGVERRFVLTAAGASLALCELGNPRFAHAKAGGEWRSGRSAGGCRNNSTWPTNPRFVLRGEGNVVVVLEQPSKPRHSDLEPLGFYIFPLPLACDLRDLTPIGKSDFCASVESAQHVTLKANEPVLVVACLFHADKEGTFTLHAYADTARLALESMP